MSSSHPPPSGSDVLDFLDSLDVQPIQPSLSSSASNPFLTPSNNSSTSISTSISASNPIANTITSTNTTTPTVTTSITTASTIVPPSTAFPVSRPATPSLTPYTPTSVVPTTTTTQTSATTNNNNINTSVTTTTDATTTSSNGWSSWLSTVTAADIMVKATEVATKVGTQLRHETLHAQDIASRALSQASQVAHQARDRANQTPAGSVAVAQGTKLFSMVSRGVSGLLDMVVPESRQLSVSLHIAGLCNVPELTDDTISALTTVFDARNMTLLVDQVHNDHVRPFLPEEISDLTLDKAWTYVSQVSPQPIPDSHIHIYVHPCIPLPQIQPTIMAYLVHITGAGRFSAITLSQSFHYTGPHSDTKWTQLVLRSALRTTADDFLADLVHADTNTNNQVDNNTQHRRSRGPTPSSSIMGSSIVASSTDIVNDPQQLMQTVGTI